MPDELKKAVTDFIAARYSKILEEEVCLFVARNGGMRNGYYSRWLETAYGRFCLSIPRVREGGFFPSFIEKYKRQDETFLLCLLSVLKRELTVPDSIRSIWETYNISYSQSFVRCLKKERISAREEFEKRPIEKFYQAVFMDGTYIHIDGESWCLMFLIGMNDKKEKSVLDFDLAKNENKESYKKMLSSLKEKGLEGISLFVSDGFCDADELAAEIFPMSRHQRCLVHFERNIKNLMRDGIEYSDICPFLSDVKEIVTSDDDYDKSRLALNKTIRKHTLISSIIKAEENSLNCLIAHKTLDKKFWQETRTTNTIEGFNHHFKKRIKFREQFKTKESVMEFVSLFILKN